MSDTDSRVPSDGPDDERASAWFGQPLSDAVVAAAVRGDPDAIAALYRLLSPRLLRYLALLVGSDAEDVAAETWAEALRSLPTYVGGRDRIAAWLAGIARHRASAHWRAARSRPQAGADIAAFTEVLAAENDTAASAEESLATAEALTLIASLPTDQAEAVFLRAIVGLTAPEAAEVLGKRPGAVRTAAHRGLKALRRRLENEV